MLTEQHFSDVGNHASQFILLSEHTKETRRVTNVTLSVRICSGFESQLVPTGDSKLLP
jgi:hypothetical protein